MTLPFHHAEPHLRKYCANFGIAAPASLQQAHGQITRRIAADDGRDACTSGSPIRRASKGQRTHADEWCNRPAPPRQNGRSAHSAAPARLQNPISPVITSSFDSRRIPAHRFFVAKGDTLHCRSDDAPDQRAWRTDLARGHLDPAEQCASICAGFILPHWRAAVGLQLPQPLLDFFNARCFKQVSRAHAALLLSLRSMFLSPA